MPVGTLKRFHDDRGYGFITPDDGGKDCFVHIKDARKSGIDELREGLRLAFETVTDERGRTAAVDLREL